MSEIAKGLIKHTIVLVVSKRERAIGIQAVLNKMGFRVIMALSLYDALKYVAQEMPHLVLSEALLPDGSASALFDRLQQHPVLKNTPILVNVVKKTKDEIHAMGQRKYAGFFLGKPEPRMLITKVYAALGGQSSVSPYFVASKSANLPENISMFLHACVMGSSGDQVVSKSSMQLDSRASLLCVPKEKNLLPVVVRMASNLEDKGGVINLFPMSRIVGKGREWIEKLPVVNLSEEDAPNKQVIFYDPNQERFDQFKEVLAGYDIDLVHAQTLQKAASLIKRDPEAYGCVYLHELANTASSIEWKKAYASIPGNLKPTLVIGTTSQNARSTDKTLYIKRPFGLGVMVETLEASFCNAAEVSKELDKAGMAGIEVKFQAPAKLLGLDETGGVVELRFPVLPGVKFNIDHPFFSVVFDGGGTATAVSSKPAPNKADTWHVKFDSIAAGTSKIKYWEKVQKALEEFKGKDDSASSGVIGKAS